MGCPSVFQRKAKVWGLGFMKGLGWAALGFRGALRLNKKRQRMWDLGFVGCRIPGSGLTKVLLGLGFGGLFQSYRV